MNHLSGRIYVAQLVIAWVGLIHPGRGFEAQHGYITRVIDTVAEWLRKMTRNRLESFCVGSSPDSVNTFGIFYWQILHKPFSHSHKPTVHILTLTHTYQKSCYEIYRSYMCIYYLFGYRKTYFPSYVIQCPLANSMLQLCIHYLSCIQYKQGSAHMCFYHLY